MVDARLLRAWLMRGSCATSHTGKLGVWDDLCVDRDLSVMIVWNLCACVCLWGRWLRGGGVRTGALRGDLDADTGESDPVRLLQGDHASRTVPMLSLIHI